LEKAFIDRGRKMFSRTPLRVNHDKTRKSMTILEKLKIVSFARLKLVCVVDNQTT